MRIIPTFFRPVKTLCDLIPRASSLFDVNAKRQKDRGDKFGPYAFVQDLLWTRVEGLVLNMDYLENRHRNFIQKKYGRKIRLPRTRFLRWTVIFLLYGLFTPLMTSKGKKKNKAVSKQSKQFLLIFLFFDLKNWVSKFNLRLSFDLQ